MHSVCLLYLTGNGMILYVIVSNKEMRTATNYLLASLAICDLLISTTAPATRVWLF